MADAKDKAKKKPPSKSHPRHPDRHGAPRRGLHYGVGAFGYFGLPMYGPNYYAGVGGQVTSTGGTTNPPGGGNHLSPDQFVGYPGGYSTDAGNYTGVQALAGAAGNGGAGGDGSSSGGDGGGQ